MSASGAASLAPLATRADRLPSSPAAEVHPHADAAEEVRAWLVTARGGAPFLSGSDGRRLADWLETGVGVRDLLRAIDETAAHRRAKRLRGPFTLRSIEPALRRGPADNPARASQRGLCPQPAGGHPRTPAEPPIAILRAARRESRLVVQALGRALPADQPGDTPWPDSTALELLLTQRTGGDPASLDDSAFLELSAVVRAFFEEAWIALAQHHPALLAEALTQLGDVAELVEEGGRAALCEEYAREALRSRYPLLRSGGLLG